MDSLEVRAGNSSSAPLIGEYRYANDVRGELVSAGGFYLRMRAACSSERRLQAVFASFSNISTDGKLLLFARHYRCFCSSEATRYVTSQ